MSAFTPVRTDAALLSAAGNPGEMPRASPMDNNGAWVLLLPAPQTWQRILCLGLGRSDFRRPLQYWHDDVDVVQGCQVPGRASHLHIRSGRESGTTTLEWFPGQPLPFAPGTFSGIVIRLAGRASVTWPGLPDRSAVGLALVREARRLLTSSGILYLEIDNTWSVRNLGLLLRGKWAELSVGPGRRSWLKALHAAGFPRPTLHPLLLERGELTEILPTSGHTSPQQTVGLSERLKAWFLGPRGAPYFATGYGVMAGSGDDPSLLDELLKTVATSPGVSLPDSPIPSFRAGRIISTPDKAFVECLPVTVGPESLFLVVPLAAETVARRRREIAAINQLKASRLPITELLPGTACEACCLGRPVFIYSALQGRAIDLPVPQLPTLMQLASDLLADFNRSSQETIQIDAVTFAACVGSGLAGAQGRYPEARNAIGRLEAALERCLLGRFVRTVWVHGDYKIENLLFDMQRLRITGVIDWELASPVGLLAVDLLYLLAYHRVTCGKATDVVEFIEQALLSGRWMAHEQGLLDAYGRAFAITEPYMVLASAAFVIHHIGVRFNYASPAGPRQRLPAILDALAREIEAMEPIGDPA